MAVYKIVSPPTTEPVSVSELKLHARIDQDEEDSMLAIYIQAAREECEQRIERALITQTIARVSDDWPSEDDIEILRGPVQSVASVTYIDEAGATQTVSSSAYTLDNANENGRAWVLLQDGEEWPDVGDYGNAVTVTFVAGYGAASAVPALLKAWIIMAATWMNENRSAGLPRDFGDGMLDRYRAWAV